MPITPTGQRYSPITGPNLKKATVRAERVLFRKRVKNENFSKIFEKFFFDKFGLRKIWGVFCRFAICHPSLFIDVPVIVGMLNIQMLKSKSAIFSVLCIGESHLKCDPVEGIKWQGDYVATFKLVHGCHLHVIFVSRREPLAPCSLNEVHTPIPFTFGW